MGSKASRIEFGICAVEWIPEQRLCITRFPDGTEAHACPHETPEYRSHAREKSTGDIDLYCWQHDIAHVIVGLQNGGVSRVLWALAHGDPVDTPECESEESEAQRLQLQLFLRA